MADLRKTIVSRYEVLVDEQTVGQVWNWHSSWSAQAVEKAYYGLKSRKKAIEQVIRTYETAKLAI